MTALLGQASRFLLVGLALIGFDGLSCAALVLAGVPLVVANPLARAMAALLGYLLHLRFTFRAARIEGNVSPRWRYLAVWLLLTWMSTRVLLTAQGALDTRIVLWLKLPVEAALAFCSFVLMKQWVYRR